LRATTPNFTASEKDAVIAETAYAWLTKQGVGLFSLDEADLAVAATRFMKLSSRKKGVSVLKFGVMDLVGALTVTNPDEFNK